MKIYLAAMITALAWTAGGCTTQRPVASPSPLAQCTQMQTTDWEFEAWLEEREILGTGQLDQALIQAQLGAD